MLDGEHSQIFRDKVHVLAVRWDSFVDQKAYPRMFPLWVSWPEVAASSAVRGNHIRDGSWTAMMSISATL